METLFLTVLRMSLSASAVILVVLMIRTVLRRAPKKWSYLLWSVVGFRLCCPVSFRSAFSLFAVAPAQAQRVEHLLSETPVAAAPTLAPSTVTLPTAAPQITTAPQISTVHLWPTLGIIVWCIGMAALLIYSLVRILRLRSLLIDAVQLEPGVWQSDRVATPFLMGLIHPKVYIPVETDAETRRYVLAHERVHLRRRDHWIKAFAFLLLMLHWFNPLCWLAFVLMNRDMELSCDERVLAEYGAFARSYSLSLLHFATAGRFPAPEMLAFGESDVKRRVKNALKWKKPKRWVTVLAAVLCVAAVAACAANPRDEGEDLEREAIRSAAIQATELSTRQSQVVDANGSLLPDIADAYEEQLQEVFTEDSGYISQYTETMRLIVDHFDKNTDVVVSSDVMEFQVQNLKVDGDRATLVSRVKSLQRYIPHREDGSYAVVFAASKEKVTYTLEKGGDGKWRVASFTSEDYVFGSPKEMGFTGEYEEKTFPTREEACRYAASYAPGVQNADTSSESMAIQRMLTLQGDDILYFASRMTPEDSAYYDAFAAALRNAAAHGAAEKEEAYSTMVWYFADLYLSALPGGGFGTGCESFHFEENLTEPVIHIYYENPQANVSERLQLEDDELYWLIRNNYTFSERVETAALAPYKDIIHRRAADTSERIDGLSGYDLISFYSVDSLSDSVHQYEVYVWYAAYHTDDPNALILAGGVGLDSQGRVIGLHEEDCYFVVRDDGVYRFMGFDVPFGYDDASIRAHNLELVQQTFAQGPEA